MEISNNVNELVEEIAAAAREQAEGIGQLNTAVVEMDRVVQANASTAEESASSSQEMKSQAEIMGQMVVSLNELVGGSSGNDSNKSVSDDMNAAATRPMEPGHTEFKPSAVANEPHSLPEPGSGF